MGVPRVAKKQWFQRRRDGGSEEDESLSWTEETGKRGVLRSSLAAAIMRCDVTELKLS